MFRSLLIGSCKFPFVSYSIPALELSSLRAHALFAFQLLAAKAVVTLFVT